jgi:sarcosine oxidase/L-pipecolate oxidase
VKSFSSPQNLKGLFDMDAEIIIIGAGIFGLSTAYHLAQRTSDPSAIIVLDRAPPPSRSAASTDLNKIVRADYSNRLYTELGLEAIEAWENNPIFKDEGVYHQTGWIMCDEKGSDLGQRIRKNFQGIGLDPMQELSEDDVRQDWGGLLKDADLSPFGSFYWNPLAGWADAGRALEILAREIKKMGVRYIVDEANRLILGENGVKGVETKSGDKLNAEKVLLCTGAWTSALVTYTEDALEIPSEDRIEAQMTAAGVCVAHVQLSEEERMQYERLPVYVYGGQGRCLHTLMPLPQSC